MFSIARFGTDLLSRISSVSGRPPSSPPARLISSIAIAAPRFIASADVLVV